jgi:pentatricopeptide repeat protein
MNISELKAHPASIRSEETKNSTSISLSPSRDTSQTVFNATRKMNRFAETGNAVKTVQIFNSIISKGEVPNTVTCNTLIKSHVKSGEIERALEVLDYMEENDTPRDLITYNTLIHGCGKKGYEEKAFEMYNRILEAKLTPDIFTFTNLINASIRSDGNMEKALNLLRNSTIEPNIITYNSIIKGLLTHGNIEAAKTLLKSIKGSVEKDAWTFGTFMQWYHDQGEYEKVFSEMEMMQLEGVKPDGFHLRLMMSASFSQGNYEKVIALAESFKPLVNKLLVPLLLKAHIRLNLFPKALELLREDTFEIKNYYIVLMGCGVREAKIAFDLFNEIREKGFAVDAVATHKVVDLCYKVKMTEEAKSVLSSLRNRESRLN